MSAILPSIALELCEEVRRDNRGKWYTFNGMWCWGCATFSRGDPKKMCFSNSPDHRGCAQVNRRYDAKFGPWERP
jgi:hypothetical protein